MTVQLNITIQAGHLTRDPELRHTNSGTAVVNGCIASNRRVPRGDEWVDEVTYVDFTIWGKRAESFSRYHRKGDAAFLQGRLTLDSWDDKSTGEKRSKLRMTVEDWQFNREKSSPSQATSVAGDDDTPF